MTLEELAGQERFKDEEWPKMAFAALEKIALAEETIAALHLENTRIKAACDIFEKNSADACELQQALILIDHQACEASYCPDNPKLMEEALTQIYVIAHGYGTCHDGCPVKQDGKKFVKEHGPHAATNDHPSNTEEQ